MIQQPEKNWQFFVLKWLIFVGHPSSLAELVFTAYLETKHRTQNTVNMGKFGG